MFTAAATTRAARGRRVLASCAAVAVFDGFDVQAMAFVATRLSHQWSVPLSQFGLVFAAALFGLLLGSLFVAPLADQVGRKPLAIGAAIWVGIATLLTALCTTIPQVTAARFATGIGLGTAIPVLVAVTHEAAPSHRRTLYVTLMYCGFPTGGFLGGLFTAWALPRFDWSTLFAGMGILSLALAVPLAFVLKSDRPAHSQPRRAVSVAMMWRQLQSLFVDGRALRTSLTWLLFVATLLNVYVMANWLPALLERARLLETAAAIAAGIANLGGVLGGLILGALVNRWGPRVLSIVYVLGAVFLALLGSASGRAGPAYALAFLAGFAIAGGQVRNNAIAANQYPTEQRATGVGWAQGIGRIGSIVGPALVALAIARHWSNAEILSAAALASLCAAAAAWRLAALPRS